MHFNLVPLWAATAPCLHRVNDLHESMICTNACSYDNRHFRGLKYKQPMEVGFCLHRIPCGDFMRIKEKCFFTWCIMAWSVERESETRFIIWLIDPFLLALPAHKLIGVVFIVLCNMPGRGYYQKGSLTYISCIASAEMRLASASFFDAFPTGGLYKLSFITAPLFVKQNHTPRGLFVSSFIHRPFGSFSMAAPNVWAINVIKCVWSIIESALRFGQ